MTDRRVLRTRAALADAVIAIASEKDFSEVTIAEIAERAGIGYATFFRHYRDKDALLSDVADVLVDELLVVLMPALIVDDTAAAAVKLCAFVDERRPICHALLAGGAEADIRKLLIARIVPRATAVGLPQPGGMPVELVITHTVSAMLGMLGWWLDRGAGIGAATMAASIDRLILAPARAR